MEITVISYISDSIDICDLCGQSKRSLTSSPFPAPLGCSALQTTSPEFQLFSFAIFNPLGAQLLPFSIVLQPIISSLKSKVFFVLFYVFSAFIMHKSKTNTNISLLTLGLRDFHFLYDYGSTLGYLHFHPFPVSSVLLRPTTQRSSPRTLSKGCLAFSSYCCHVVRQD